MSGRPGRGDCWRVAMLDEQAKVRRITVTGRDRTEATIKAARLFPLWVIVATIRWHRHSRTVAALRGATVEPVILCR
jgi:hypothetical protein